MKGKLAIQKWLWSRHRFEPNPWKASRITIQNIWFWYWMKSPPILFTPILYEIGFDKKTFKCPCDDLWIH